jgi:hypothetical protein
MKGEKASVTHQNMAISTCIEIQIIEETMIDTLRLNCFASNTLLQSLYVFYVN